MRKGIIKSVVVCVLIPLCLVSCQSKETDKKAKAAPVKTIVATKKALTIDLKFNGTLMPIRAYSVVSPVEGRVNKINFKYGDYVKKGQLLFVLSSPTLKDNFSKAVTEFLTQKSAYLNEKSTYAGDKMLYKAGVISEADYLSSKSSADSALIAYHSAKVDLEKITNVVNVDSNKIEGLSIEGATKLGSTYDKAFSNINVYADHSGVALFPVPGESGDSDDSSKSEKLIIGSGMKEDQLLLSVGDLSGLDVQFDVNEMDINQIKVDMPVVVTGDAFPTLSLKGKVDMVSTQAKPTSSDDAAQGLFQVSVDVPKLDADVLNIVRIGMSCHVKIQVKLPESIVLPMSAITVSNGASSVKIMGTDGKVKSISVVTGKATADGEIAIIKGVKAGDKVVVND